MIFLLSAFQIEITPPVKKLFIEDQSYIYVDELIWTCKEQEKICISAISEMKNLFQKAMFPKGTPKPKSQPSLNKLDIQITTSHTPKSAINANESYKLKVDADKIQIEAENPFGVARALATLSQLITERPGDEYENGLYSLQKCEIEDYPHYRFRSLLVDTSRHFIPVAAIKRQINALTMSKMNVMHMHITDSEAFAYQPVAKPADQYGKGAYYVGGYQRYGFDDLKEIARYADALGVFMVIEYDMPGHVQSWRHASQEIVTTCGTVNPINELTYVYIKAMIQDIMDAVFTPLNKVPFIHLGGDEVSHECWGQIKEIAEYMKAHNMTTKQLWQEFHQKVAKIINSMNSDTARIYWQESFENGNDFSGMGVVHSWYNNEVCKKAANQGIHVIRSQGWYLDLHSVGRAFDLYQDTWMDFYQRDAAEGIDDEHKKYILGGGACMWTEKVSEGNLDEQMWPRTAAVGDTLWAGPGDRNVTDAVIHRMNKFTCKLISVGVASGPIRPMAPCPGPFDEPRDN